MDPAVEYACWYTCSLLSLSVAAVFFSISQFVELQFANSKPAFSVFIVILLIVFCSFVNKAKFIRTQMDLISVSRFRWIVKAIVEFSILIFVTMLILLIKYPRFRVSDKQDGSISATSKQGNDQMGFFSAATFSFYIFSTSMLLKLREEYGLFYMCLELTMHAAVEIPGIGGSILNWYYVGPTAFYCFLLIIVRCYFHSSDEVRRRGGNGGDHHDDDNDGDRRPTTVSELVGDELRQPDLELNQLGDGDNDAEYGGGGGRIIGDQGRRTDIGSAGSSWEIVSAEEGDEHKTESDEGILSGEIERMLSTSNVHGGREITKKAADVLVSLLPRKLSLLSVINYVKPTISIFCMTATCVSIFPWFESYYFIVMDFTVKYKDVVKPLVFVMLNIFLIWATGRVYGSELNQEGGSHDGAEGGGGGRKTGDQGHSAGSGQEIVFAEEGDEHKAERAEGISSFDLIERITSTSNLTGERVITRRKHAVPSDQEKFPATTDGKSAATGANF